MRAALSRIPGVESSAKTKSCRLFSVARPPETFERPLPARLQLRWETMAVPGGLHLGAEAWECGWNRIANPGPASKVGQSRSQRQQKQHKSIMIIFKIHICILICCKKHLCICQITVASCLYIVICDDLTFFLLILALALLVFRRRSVTFGKPTTTQGDERT